jgi:hypothetical protein
MADVPSGPIPPPPPPPARLGPGSLRPRTVGEILSAAFEIYKNNAQGHRRDRDHRHTASISPWSSITP